MEVIFDIETSPAKVFTWGMYEQDVIKVIEQPFMLSFAYKWKGGRTKVLALPDFKLYKKDPHNDYELVKALREVLDQADIVVGQNSKKFDVKWFNTRCISHRLPPPSPFKQLDILEISKKNFKWMSNKLDFVSDRLGHGRKAQHEGFGLWEKCMNGCPKAWKRMKRYNKRDVEITEEVYEDYLAWIRQTSPVWGKKECLHCKSTETQRRGTEVTSEGHFQRHQCMNCGKWFKGAKIISKP